jgi:hypothetical protein
VAQAPGEEGVTSPSNLRGRAASMKRVVVESPFRGATPAEQRRNIAYAKAAVMDCIARREAPIASHLLLTQPGLLLDADPEQREIGIAAGLAWALKANVIAFYTDYGISSGMKAAAAFYEAEGISHRIEYRTLNVFDYREDDTFDDPKATRRDDAVKASTTMNDTHTDFESSLYASTTLNAEHVRMVHDLIRRAKHALARPSKSSALIASLLVDTADVLLALHVREPKLTPRETLIGGAAAAAREAGLSVGHVLSLLAPKQASSGPTMPDVFDVPESDPRVPGEPDEDDELDDDDEGDEDDEYDDTDADDEEVADD